jgi:hypothetical protein
MSEPFPFGAEALPKKQTKFPKERLASLASYVTSSIRSPETSHAST